MTVTKRPSAADVARWLAWVSLAPVAVLAVLWTLVGLAVLLGPLLLPASMLGPLMWLMARERP